MSNKLIYLVLADTVNGKRNYLPYALLYIGNSLKKSGYDVKIKHCTEDKFQEVVDEVCSNNPLFVGFSVITGLHVSYAVKISKKIKEKNKLIPICWGGVHPSLFGEQCLKEDYIDFIINGEGEESAVEFANQLISKKEFSKVNGLGYKVNGKVFSAERRFISDLSTVRADFSLVNAEEYFQEFPEGEKRVLNYLSSRGCPHRCTFCYNLNYNNRKWRPYPIQIIKQDIDFLKEKYKIDGLSFGDDNFYVNRKRAHEILEYLDLPSGFELRMDYITDEVLTELKRLKVRSFLVGVESGSERSQKLVQKDYGVATIKKTIDLFAKYHFRCHYSFIIALPGEKFEDIKETVKCMLYIIDHHKEGSFTPGQFLPYPGTPLYDVAVKSGFKAPTTTEGWAVLDRWDNKMELPWASVDSNFCYYIKWYSFFVAARINLITRICKWRLKTLNFVFPLDLKILLLYYHLGYHSNLKVGKLIRTVAKMFQFKIGDLQID